MTRLDVCGSRLELGEQVVDFDEMFTSELYALSDHVASMLKDDTSVANEAYLNWVLPSLALTVLIKRYSVQKVTFRGPVQNLEPLLRDIAFSNGLSASGGGRPLFIRLKNILYGHVLVLCSLLYLAWKMCALPYKGALTIGGDKFSVVRTPAARKKLRCIPGLILISEPLDDTETVYAHFPKRLRLQWILTAWIKCYSVLSSYCSIVRKYVGIHTATEVFYYYSKRVLHTLLYSAMLNELLSENTGKTFYTGNNLDRFAIVEEQVARRYGIETVGIPHGLEYGFKLPYGFTSDRFYTTSWQAAQHLNRIYDSTKYVFDNALAERIFSHSNAVRDDEPSIVFLTEPRELEVNYRILDKLLPLMDAAGLRLLLKLHPKDSPGNYASYHGRLDFIEDLGEALTRNICFARKSTALLEAAYNHSAVAAILVSQKDRTVFDLFPSLQDGRITVTFDVEQLFEWIMKMRNSSSAARGLRGG